MPSGVYTRSEETRKKIGEANRGKHRSKEAKQKISEANKGKHRSEEAKRRMSIAQKGRKSGMTGKHHSEEAKRKMSIAAQKGKGKCKGANHFNWKGGKTINRAGYIFIHKPEHPFNRNKYVREHRLVVEKYLGRYLKPEEHCHHINGVKDDNRIENLMVFSSNSAHTRFHKNPNNVKPGEIIFSHPAFIANGGT